MTTKPNILFLMTDQMQGRVLNADHPCKTPNLDKLAARGTRFTRAYTPNAICSPARAILMTGLLPHNHGVLTVNHTMDDDQVNLRTQYPHWAQRLAAANYKTGYFGKWHVERSNQLEDFGWQQHSFQDRYKNNNSQREAHYSLEGFVDLPTGYRRSRFYGVTDLPPEQRGMGKWTSQASEFLDEALKQDNPWCCFVSITEPHDPFICGEEAFAQYDVEAAPLPPNLQDDLKNRPNIYHKASRVWQNWTERQHREAATCYWASITEIDSMFARLLDKVEMAGQMENTIVILTSDHGELLGAHGLYCKNIMAAEEAYNIPMVVAGPGISEGQISQARVGLHDLCPTLLELTESESISHPDSHSFAPALRDPAKAKAGFQTGYAEYFGGRMLLTQRILWNGIWKFIFNGFDFDELYNLEADPYEMHNLAGDAEQQVRMRQMMSQMWKLWEETGDTSLLDSQYPILRLAPFGPEM
jgi:arylsulfatase A-like enzyme